MTNYESDVESKLANAIKKEWPTALTLKLHKRHWPDRLIVIGKQTWFVELKRPKGPDNPAGRPNRGQLAQHNKILSMGGRVIISDSVEDVVESINTDMRDFDIPEAQFTIDFFVRAKKAEILLEAVACFLNRIRAGDSLGEAIYTAEREWDF